MISPDMDRMELALEAVGVDLWENDLVAGVVTRKPTRVFAQLGYGEEEAASLVDDIFSIVHPDDIPSVQQAIADHLAGRTASYHCEFRLREKTTGKWIWHANFGKAIDPGRAGRRFVGVTFTIDGDKAADERFGRIFDSVPVALALNDDQGRVLGVNKAFTAATGYTHGDMPTLSRWWELACPDQCYRDSIIQRWQSDLEAMHASRMPPPPMEVSITCRSRNVRTFLVSSASLDDGGGSTHLVALYDVTERRRSELALENSERQLRFVLQGSELGFWDWDIVAGKVERNERWATMLGYTHMEIQQTTRQWTDFIHPDDRERAWESIAEVLDGRRKFHRAEYRMLHKDGSVRWILDQASVMQRASDGKPTRMCGTHTDITKRKAIEEELRQGKEQLQLLIEHAPASLAMFDKEMRYLAVSRRWREEYALGSRDLRGCSHYEIFPDIPERWKQVHRRGLAGEVIRAYEDHFERADGAIHWLHWEVQPWHTGKGDVAGIIIFAEDITEQKKSKEQIEHLAYHDALTGLPNRALFLDRLNLALANARRSHHCGAILFVDLDQFKKINDVYGHRFGDQVLRDVTARLRRHVREGDTIARLGGDEFVILLPDLSGEMEGAVRIALTVGEKLRLSLDGQKCLDDQSYTTTASIGVSIFPQGTRSLEDLIRDADIAMYRAKQRGRNALVFFEEDMQSVIAERFSMEQALRQALDGDGLQLHLQSTVDAAGGVVGAEALLRWIHPSRGMVMPATFIPLAEETGLIVEIGEWVLREACRLLVQINHLGRSHRISVNVSPCQFRQGNFVDRVTAICAETGADPSYLTLEITESLLVEGTSEVVSRMLALSELGIRFSIDDFGTGYSSLSYLKRLPINEIKIDKSFVQDIPHDTNDVALVEAILSMAHHLGLEVVAEGVESEDQFQFLAARNCEHYQGYLFHRPQIVDEWLAGMRKEHD